MQDKKKLPPRLVSASDLIEMLFSQIFIDGEKFDAEVVALTKEHLGASSPHSKAGSNLANALIELAKSRAAGGKQ